MRTITADERNLLKASRFDVRLRVELENQAGVWQDMSALNGVDFVLGAKWSDLLDTPVMAGTVTLSRRVGAQALPATMAASPVNHPGGGGYTPFVRGGQKVRIHTACVTPGAAPAGGDWKEVFLGKVDDPEWGGTRNAMTLAISDVGAWLQGTVIKEEHQYGTEEGIPVETVMQQILDANPVPKLGAVALYVPTSPGWNIKTYTQARVSILQALRDLAIQIGWEVRYRYDAANTFRLTFYEPDRAKAIADTSFGPSEYFELPNVGERTDDIRNSGRVYYVDSTTGTREFQEYTVPASIAVYGERYIEISEDTSSNIDTDAEALDMVTAMVKDLSVPLLNQTMRTSFFWPVQLGDLYDFTANGEMYDSTQQGAAVSIEHELTRDTRRTSIGVRGKPAGAYSRWLQLGGVIDTREPGEVPPDPVIGPAFVEGTAEGGEAEGAMHIPIVFDKHTDRIDFFATEAEDGIDPPPPPELSENRRAWSVTRHEGVIASAETWATEITISTQTGWQRRVVGIPFGPTGLRGKPFTHTEVCEDGPFEPLGPPENLVVTMSTVGGKVRATLVWDAGDPIAPTRVWRNGVMVTYVAAGVETLVDDDLWPDTDYQYWIQHILAGSTSAFNRSGDETSDSPALVAPTWASGFPANGGYDSTEPLTAHGLVLIRAVNPDPLAYTYVYMNNQEPIGGVYSIVTILDPGETDRTLNAGDLAGDPTNEDRWFYLVAVRPGYVDSAASAIQSAHFGF